MITENLLNQMIREEEASISSLAKNTTNDARHNLRMIAKAEGSIRILNILKNHL